MARLLRGAAVMESTCDPHVVIEERREGVVRYRRDDGARWEVHGQCVGVARCIVGAVIDGREVETIEEARRLWATYAFPLDAPVWPSADECCPFRYVVLAEGAGF